MNLYVLLLSVFHTMPSNYKNMNGSGELQRGSKKKKKKKIGGGGGGSYFAQTDHILKNRGWRRGRGRGVGATSRDKRFCRGCFFYFFLFFFYSARLLKGDEQRRNKERQK